MNFPIIVNVITIIYSAAVAGFVYGRNPKSAVAKSFLMLLLSFILWAIAQTLLYVQIYPFLTIPIDQSTYVLGLVIAWTFYRFMYNFTATSIGIPARYLVVATVLTVVSLILLFLPNGFITGGPDPIIFTQILYT